MTQSQMFAQLLFFFLFFFVCYGKMHGPIICTGPWENALRNGRKAGVRGMETQKYSTKDEKRTKMVNARTLHTNPKQGARTLQEPNQYHTRTTLVKHLTITPISFFLLLLLLRGRRRSRFVDDVNVHEAVQKGC